ncbi:MAG: hypothetical protein WBK76_04835 [Candidatus Saccharimonadales bacterium]
MNDLVKVKFIKDRGRRHEGDVVSYDPISAAHLISEGFVEEYVEKVLGVDTLPEAPASPPAPKTSRPVKSDES